MTDNLVESCEERWAEPAKFLTTTAICLSGGRTPTWNVTVTREDGEARTYRVMAVDEEGATKQAVALFDLDMDAASNANEDLSEESFARIAEKIAAAHRAGVKIFQVGDRGWFVGMSRADPAD